MAYYIRVLGTTNPNIHLDELIHALKAEGLVAKLAIPKDEQPSKWTLCNVSNADGIELAQIERNPVIEGEPGQGELDEFRETIHAYEPRSAAEWLEDYFDKVQVIYAVQLLNAAFEDDNYPIISAIRTAIWNKTGGILQADNEGFSNESGYHILWQFSETVTGDWQCAVLNAKGEWENFRMDLGDPVQQEEFKQGKVPSKSLK